MELGPTRFVGGGFVIGSVAISGDRLSAEALHVMLRALPCVLSSALDDAELVADGVGENCGLIATIVIVFLEQLCAEVDQPSDLYDEIVDEKIEVHSVLGGLRFGNALEREVV